KSIWPTERLRAIRYYLTALLHGAYGPRLAGAVLMQIILPDGLYRTLSDRWIDFSQLVTGRRQSL
ncbi:MAG TPA: glycosyltransferase family 2 protein, partial [Sphingobium sp.]|nr:glycosyltransferase family 2 protein [Sphingobium sp.]